MPELVRDHPLLLLPRRTVGREGQHRVLHSFDRPFNSCRVGPRIAIPLLAEVLDRLASHAIDFVPLVRRGAVETLDQNSIVAAGIPAEVGAGGKGEVADVGSGIVPDE